MKRFILLIGVLLVLSSHGFSQVVKLLPTNAVGTNVKFGTSTAADGDYVVVGATDDDQLVDNNGAAFVFRKNGNNYVQEAKLLPNESNQFNQFGESVAIDGNLVVVCGSNSTNNQTGKCFVFKKSGSNWSQISKITPSPSSGFYGSRAVLTNDFLFVSAANENITSQLIQAGAVYVYQRSGDNFSFFGKLTSPNSAANGFFGTSISVQGNTLVVSAPGENILKGRVYVYTWNGSSWGQPNTVEPANLASGNFFGQSVSLSGSYLYIGTPGDSDAAIEAGAVYVYRKDGNSWTQVVKLKANDGDANDRFGHVVVTVGDNVVITAPSDEEKERFGGTAYYYLRNGNNWVFQNKIYSTDPNEGENFGLSANASADGTITFGAIGDDAQNDSGAAFVMAFEVSSTSEVQAFAEQLSLFPNPASDKLFVKWSHPIEGKTPDSIMARIIDLQGKTLWNGYVNPAQGPVDVTRLSKGTYLLELDVDDVRFGKQFIKE